jgi:hypothetical protein
LDGDVGFSVRRMRRIGLRFAVDEESTAIHTEFKAEVDASPSFLHTHSSL